MADVVLVGRWSGSGDTRSLNLSGTVMGRVVSGSGKIRLRDNRGEVRSLDLDGRIGDSRLTVDFDSKG